MPKDNKIQHKITKVIGKSLFLFFSITLVLSVSPAVSSASNPGVDASAGYADTRPVINSEFGSYAETSRYVMVYAPEYYASLNNGIPIFYKCYGQDKNTKIYLDDMPLKTESKFYSIRANVPGSVLTEIGTHKLYLVNEDTAEKFSVGDLKVYPNIKDYSTRDFFLGKYGLEMLEAKKDVSVYIQSYGHHPNSVIYLGDQPLPTVRMYNVVTAFISKDLLSRPGRNFLRIVNPDTMEKSEDLQVYIEPSW